MLLRLVIDYAFIMTLFHIITKSIKEYQQIKNKTKNMITDVSCAISQDIFQNQ